MSLVLLALLVLVLLAGCGQDTPSMFRPESQGARHISNLTYAVFAILSGVAITVWVVLAITIIRDRRRRPDSEVEQTQGNATIEVVWTLIPAVIIAVLLILTIRTTGLLTTSAGNVMMKVTSHQWWWGAEYPDGQFSTANEIHVPVDRQVTADMMAQDVIHSYWVPQMGGKIDMIPGHVRELTFVPTKVGTYLGECSEFCGHQHAKMRFLLIVETPAQFSAWYANEQRPAAKPAGALAAAGAATISKLSCIGCHTIRGTVAAGVVAPDLTHFGGRESLAAVTLRNTPDNLRRWLQDPQQVKPGNLMPTVPLTAQQLDELVAYLEGLK